jgi:superfamily II DNA or RNA helicase
MKLRPYQEKVLSQLNQALKTTDEVVIASAPNSGKTLIAIEFMKQESNKTFLVLTHGTIVLKEQWSEKFAEAGLKFSEQLGQERITYGLPQGVYRKAGQPVDYLIIDEAHEFTFAEMVKEIKAKFKPKKIIYLTGTPSKFIAKGYETIIVPAIDLIKEGYSSDLYVGMVSTTAAIDKDDYNADGDVKENKAATLESTVETDLDALLSAMHSRLCETGAFKGSPRLRKTVEWAPTLGRLQKTMIACRSIKQANKIQEYFDTKGIRCLVSHSLNDVQSENIQLFKTSVEYQVLIVVDRGILGFDMHDLVNVVDLTCSKNINRIYQLYARVMRQSKDSPKKYFFKFSTDPEMQLMKFYMNAALMLMFEDFISKYNGKNLNGCKVPVMVPRSPRESEAGVGSPKAKVLNKSINIDKLFMETVQAGAVLIDIYNKIGQNTNEYAYTTFGEIKIKEFDQWVIDPESSKEQIIQLALSNQKRPLGKLGGRLASYLMPSSSSFDPIFKQTIYDLRPDWNRNASFSRMLAAMPSYVEFAEGQIWTTIRRKYKFIDAKYGEFWAIAENLMRKSWPNNLSGHTEMKRQRQLNRPKKKVKNLCTGAIFDSASLAAQSASLSEKSVYYSAQHGHKAGGYNWAYCDEHGNIIETKKKKNKK